EAQQREGARARGRRFERPADVPSPAAAFAPPSLAERDLLVLLLHVEEARTELLPILDDADLAHPGLRALLAALRRTSGPPEALMSELSGDGERGLLAALLIEEREWADAHSQVLELRKRYHIRRRRDRVREVRETIARAQATGGPGMPEVDIELVDSTKGVRLPSEIEPPAETDEDDTTDRRIDLTPGPVGRTEDPVRLYLREMGKVSLLTREGEITLAKRIEEGKDEATGATLSTALAIEKI